MNREGDYWRVRRDELLAQMAEDEAELYGKLEKLYAAEVAKLERDIASYYQRYGEGNVIEYRKLLVSLSDEDRSLLFERMEDFARKYPQYAHLMPIRESIYKLNELEGIQAAMRIQQLEIGAVEQELFNEHFEAQAQRGANLAAEQMGFGQNFYNVNAEVIADTVGAAWAAGKSFSERIWENREKLASYLNDDFAKSVARGVAYDKIARSLSDRFEGVSTRDAKRLVYTEGTFLFNEAQARVHEGDFETYRLSCVHDGKTCDICRELEREQKSNPVKFSERDPGINFPPLHPWCRCSYEVVVDDWEAWIDAYVNARGGDAASPRNPITDYGVTDVSGSNGADSLAKYTVDGKLTEEREELHRSILEELFYGARSTESPVFTVMGGGSAAGKSTMIKSGNVKLPSRTVMVDSDAIKAMLPEYRDMVKAGDAKAAAYVHEESSALAKRALYIANNQHINVTLDGTGDGSVKSLRKKVSDAKDTGMRVEGVYATVETDIAVERSMARAEKTGRMVREDVIRDIHRKVSDILPQVAAEFDDVKVYYTGENIRLIAEGGGGKGLFAVAGEQKAFDDFIRKADE